MPHNPRFPKRTYKNKALIERSVKNKKIYFLDIYTFAACFIKIVLTSKMEALNFGLMCLQSLKITI